MNLALWVVQGLLALAFIAVGSMKVFAYEKYKALSEKNGSSGITRAAWQPSSASRSSPEASVSSCLWLPTLLPGSASGRQPDSRRSCCWRSAFTFAAMNRL